MLTRKQWHKFTRKKVNFFAAGFILMLLLTAVLAEYVAPFPPRFQTRGSALVGPSATHIFGTDALGRDIFSRVVHGTRITVMLGVSATAIAAILGMLQGLIAGYYGGIWDTLIMRFTDMLLSIPGILLAISIIAILGPGLNNVIIAIGIGSMPQFTRVVRGSVLSVKEEDYVTGARVLGQSDFFILLRHILPNIMGPVIVLATLRIAAAVLNAAALSFVGLGAQPPTPEWGAMLNEARRYLSSAWWYTVFPGGALALTVLSVNILGDSLRDILDPRTDY